MDKLEPIIRQRFWILFGLCLVMGIVGFFKGQGAIVAATQAREELLTKTKSGVPTGVQPNDDYKQKLAFINEAYAKRIAAATQGLYVSQESRMHWPEIIRDEISQKDHRTPDAITPPMAVKYASVYEQMLTDLWKKVDPVVAKPEAMINGQMNPMGRGIGRMPPGRGGRMARGQKMNSMDEYTGPVTWTQKVYCAKSDLPQKILSQTPDAESIWDAQEDIWFVELILEAIHKTNEQADSPLSAVVRKINQLELLGGAGRPEGGDTESSESEEGGMVSPGPGLMVGTGGMGGMGGADMPGMGGANAAFTAPVAFDPAEELGSDAATETESSDEEGLGSLGGGMPSSMYGGGYGNMTPGLRWVAMNDTAPFRERGFYLSVVMQQSKIPDFLINLTATPWPIQVLRFQMGPNPHAEPMPGQSRGGMGGYGEGMMPGGYGSSSMYGGSSMGMGSSPYPPSSGGARGRGGMGSMSGMGGMGGYGKKPQGAGLAFINTPADPYMGSLNSTDLVQLDIVGIITFYVPQNPDGTAAIETPDVDTPEAPVPVLEEPVEGASPEGEPGDAAPVEGEQPAVDSSAPEGAVPPTELGGETPAAAEDSATPLPEASSNPETPSIPEASPPGGETTPPETGDETETPPPGS